MARARWGRGEGEREGARALVPALHCMAWHGGMAWHGMVWYGMVLVWHGMVWHGVVLLAYISMSQFFAINRVLYHRRLRSRRLHPHPRSRDPTTDRQHQHQHRHRHRHRMNRTVGSWDHPQASLTDYPGVVWWCGRVVEWSSGGNNGIHSPMVRWCDGFDDVILVRWCDVMRDNAIRWCYTLRDDVICWRLLPLRSSWGGSLFPRSHPSTSSCYLIPRRSMLRWHWRCAVRSCTSMPRPQWCSRPSAW